MIVVEQTILLELELKQLYKYTQIYIEILYLNMVIDTYISK